MENMKTVCKLILATSLLTVVPSALVAKTMEEAYVESYARRLPEPVLLPQIAVSVPVEHGDARVVLEFTVDAAEKPAVNTPAVKAPKTLLEPLIQAVSGWRFVPRVIDEKPVASKVGPPDLVMSEPNIEDILAVR